jgi:hypothetical protein
MRARISGSGIDLVTPRTFPLAIATLLRSPKKKPNLGAGLAV